MKRDKCNGHGVRRDWKFGSCGCRGWCWGLVPMGLCLAMLAHVVFDGFWPLTFGLQPLTFWNDVRPCC